MSKKIANKQVNLNIDEMKQRLSHLIDNNRYLQSMGKVPLSSAIEGDSGLGKTSMTLQLATELGLNHFKLNLAQIEEIGDLVGFPIRQFEVCKGDECKWIDEPAVQTYTNMGYEFTGKNRMGYCPPFWIAGKEKGGILILDDWTRADPRFLQAVMELIDRQTYISWKLPPDWHIILTSNPDNGEYSVNSIDSAQRTRFISFNLIFNKDCWARWAEGQGIDGRCINFLLKHSEVIKGEVNSRSITNFFNSISSLKDFNDTESLSLIQDMGEGSIGSEVTILFTTFIHNKLDKLISPEEIFDPKEKDDDIVKKIKGVVGTGDKYRADIASILSTRIINYSVIQAQHKKVDKGFIGRLASIIKTESLSSDISFFVARQIYSSDAKTFQPLLADNKVTSYIMGTTTNGNRN